MRADLVDDLTTLRDSIGSEQHGRAVMTTCDGPPEATIALLDSAISALRALRDAPVVRFYAGDTEDAFLVNTPEEAAAIPQGGRKVRLVVVENENG